MKAVGIAIGGVVGVLLLVGLLIYGKANGINNTAVDKETQLSAQYLDNQNYLSTYTSKFYEQAGIVQAKSDAMDRIILDAVKGRYEKGSTAAPTGGQLISAMVEAYPDLSGLDSYDRILETIEAGREGYRQQQSKLLDMLRAYDKWRNTGLINKQFIKMMGVPTDNLVAQVGDKRTMGEAARTEMYRIVLTSSARQAYETGTMEPLAVPGAEPAPAS